MDFYLASTAVLARPNAGKTIGAIAPIPIAVTADNDLIEAIREMKDALMRYWRAVRTRTCRCSTACRFSH
jgi:hypothetical protein